MHDKKYSTVIVFPEKDSIIWLRSEDAVRNSILFYWNTIMFQVEKFNEDKFLVKVEFVPTVPHCSLATLIGLCIRQKLQQCLPYSCKVDINIAPGTHTTEEDGKCGPASFL